jgi:hypothetical protein
MLTPPNSPHPTTPEKGNVVGHMPQNGRHGPLELLLWHPSLSIENSAGPDLASDGISEAISKLHASNRFDTARIVRNKGWL